MGLPQSLASLSMSVMAVVLHIMATVGKTNTNRHMGVPPNSPTGWKAVHEHIRNKSEQSYSHCYDLADNLSTILW